MEHSHKNTDCYFFYYSTCKKGNACPFRHEPSALGCETMCVYWQQGNCANEHCNFRHMELKKNRKSIPCYWEMQPGGCKKPHCSFLHKNARNIADPMIPPKSEIPAKPLNQEWSNRQDDTKYDASSTESNQGRGSSEASSFIGSPVDPLIVKFEEESDNESVPSPNKNPRNVPYCKTYEDIRLEEIQAESVAYFAQDVDDYESMMRTPGKASPKKFNEAHIARKILMYSRPKKIMNDNADFKILSLEEIRERKKLQALESSSVTADETQGAIESLSNSENVGEQRLTSETLPDSEIQPSIESQSTAIKSISDKKMTLSIVNNIHARNLKRRREAILDDDSAVEHSSMSVLREKSTVKIPPVKLRRTMTRVSPKVDTIKSENEIQVRLCDSSTGDSNNESQTPSVESTTNSVAVSCFEKELKDLKSITESNQETVNSSLSNLVKDDEYLMIDTASDDIIKDIDALLD